MRTILFITSMFDFEQTAKIAGRRIPPAYGEPQTQDGPVVQEGEQFWEYAQEALLWAREAKTEKEKRSLLELARTWSQAALAIVALDECGDVASCHSRDDSGSARHVPQRSSAQVPGSLT